MRKGIILEINDLYLTLLTPEGEFLRARKLQHDYQVGEEIQFFPESASAKRNKFKPSVIKGFKARALALAAVLLLSLTAILPMYQSGKVYAYMSIDVNPSIELAVNDQLKVLQIKGYNPEGKEIVADIADWEKADAAVVAAMILDKIEEKGFFDNRNNIVIATVHNGKVKKTVDQQLNQKISEIKKATKEENLILKVMEGTSEDRENAQKQGLTTGVYKDKQNAQVKPVKESNKEMKKQEPVSANPAASPLPQKPAIQLPPASAKKIVPQPPAAGNTKPATQATVKDNRSQDDQKHKPEKKAQTEIDHSKGKSNDHARENQDQSQNARKNDQKNNRGQDQQSKKDKGNSNKK
jgi:hypothetical protein